MKKTIALLPALLLFVACASSSGAKMEPDRVFDCGPGNDIEIRAALQGPPNKRYLDPMDELTFVVEVANNSHEDLTVTSVRVEATSNAASPATSTLDPVFRTVNEEIAQGKDHLFRFPTHVRQTQSIDQRDPRDPRELRRQNSTVPTEMTVTVVLSNGDAYRCPFSMGW